jgi:hypothetical protein
VDRHGGSQTLKGIVQGQQDHGERLSGIESKLEERERLEMLAAITHVGRPVGHKVHLRARQARARGRRS